MKLRIRENTVRFRLGKSEVQRFNQNGSITSEIRLANSQSGILIYKLGHAGLESPVISFLDGILTCLLPSHEVEKWVGSEQVGIYHKIQIEDDYILELMVEKDFKCLVERSEEDHDGYPNPENQPEKKTATDERY